MNTLILGDALDHVLPHPIGGKYFNFPWTVTDPFRLNLFKITPHESYFTNQLLMTLVSASVVLLLFLIMGRKYAAMNSSGAASQSVPRGFTNLIEAMMQFIRNDVVRPVLGDKTDRFIPFLWTAFFYILVCNLLGMIPIAEIIGLATGGKLQHIGGTATGNIMITAGLAICAFLMIHLSGAKEVYLQLVAGTYGHHHEHDHDEEDNLGGVEIHAEHGHTGLGLPHDHHSASHAHPAQHGTAAPVALVLAPVLYMWNFAPHVFKPAKVDGPAAFLLLIADFVMWAFLLVLEAVGAIIKPFALAIRLFANMVAGHVVLASILALIAGLSGMAMKSSVGPFIALGCAALSCLELFVAFLQAYIFTFLTTLFIGASVSPEH